MGWLIWIVLGLVAGIIAIGLRSIGIVGALVGGFISTKLGFGDVTGFDLPSILIAVLGAMLLLFIYRMVKSRG